LMADSIKIKICGLKTLAAARTALESGADLLGLIFYPPSPRYLAPAVADQLAAELAALRSRPALVGVFVNELPAQMLAAADRYDLTYLQLTGDEIPTQVAELARFRPIIRALRLPAQITLDDALRQADSFGQLDNVTLLIDTHKQGWYGGTGETGDWSVARAIAARYPTLLAGGLTPANVAQAVTAVQPWGVDVSSGVERDDAPGEKDLTKIKQFCTAIRSI
jgi:phosphoribosylanthranilate isomerase